MKVTVESVWFHYDRPLLFQGKTETSEQVIAILSGSDPESYWLASRVSDETMEEVKRGSLDPRFCFEERRVGRVLLGEDYYAAEGEEVPFVEIDGPFPEEWMPELGLRGIADESGE